MKRKTLIRTGLLFMAAVLFTACSSNDDNKENNGTDDGKKVNIAKAVTFKVDFADYNAEQEVGVTRANNEEEKIGRQVLDLGNGILAQCTLQRDTTKQLKTIATRALPDDTYTMLAYDVATHTLRGELVGNVVGGVFRYSSFGAIEIPAGTYDFVLFNSKVSRSGNLLTVTRANAGDALIGRTTGKVIPASPYNQLVTFTMKHVAAKVKVKLMSHMPPLGIATTLASINATDVPSSSIYDASTGTWSLGTGAATSDALTYGSPQHLPFVPGRPRSYIISNEDAFFMPSTDVSKLKLTFTGGTIYNQNMTNTSLAFTPKTPLQLDQNGSYMLTVKFFYRFLYLMSDGSTGFVDKTIFGGAPAATAKTPIAVVISQSKRMAVALQDVANSTKLYWYLANKVQFGQKAYGAYGDWDTPFNTHQATSILDALVARPTSGLEETWNASYTTIGKIKGNDGNFPAFYYAGHYDPGVAYTGTPALQWYLPSLSDYLVMVSALGFADISSIPSNGKISVNGQLLRVAFMQVNGNGRFDINERYTSTESNDGAFCGIFRVFTTRVAFFNISLYRKAIGTVRAFVKY